MSVKLKALVVDDSRIMRSMVMDGVNKTKLAEFEFVEAVDGADALTKFDPATIDIAFIDWNMPNMTGPEFVKKARAFDDAEGIPLVMVTSEKTMAKMQEALDGAGADVFISKPFTVEELTFKLKKPVEKAQLNQIRRARRQREGAKQPAAGGFFSNLFS